MRLSEVLIQTLKLVVARIIQPSIYVIFDVAVAKLSMIRMIDEFTFKLGEQVIDYRLLDQVTADALIALGVPVLQITGKNAKGKSIDVWCVAGNVKTDDATIEEVASAYARTKKGIVSDVTYVEYKIPTN